MALISIDQPRAALVTGASRGLGRAIAVGLADLGVAITINYARREDAARAVVELIQSRGGKATAVRADVTNAQQVHDLVDAARQAHGPIGILVNNAGIGNARNVFDNTVDDFDTTFSTNVRSAFVATQAVLPDMREMRYGRLIFLSSTAAMTGGVISAPYAGSKAALEGMMRHYAANLMNWNITANAISPAFIDTDLFEGVALPSPDKMPLGRMGKPDEVAMVAQAMVACGYMTGQTIQVNAGRYMT